VSAVRFCEAPYKKRLSATSGSLFYFFTLKKYFINNNLDMDLEHILFSQGFGTRKTCRILILSGHVCINGEKCEDPFADFSTEDFDFSVAGKLWHFHEKAYIVLNKPKGYECSHRPQYHPSIYTLFPEQIRQRGIQSVGRLDEDTTGLLIFSDDGQFIHRMESPKWKVPKIYEAETEYPVNEEQISTLISGVMIDGEDKPVAVLSCRAISECIMELTIAEGKYHQVKKMIAASGNKVYSLKRTCIGQFHLPEDLNEGMWRWVNKKELSMLEKYTK
jgi:16S rRNA pseudouridine516 synthase